MIFTESGTLMTKGSLVREEMERKYTWVNSKYAYEASFYYTYCILRKQNLLIK